MSSSICMSTAKKNILFSQSLILLTCLCLFWKPIFWPWLCQGNTFSCLPILQTILLFFICVTNTSKYFSFTSIDFFLFQISREWGGGYWRKINSTALSCESGLDSLIQNRTFNAEENMLKWFIHFHTRVFDRFVNLILLGKHQHLRYIQPLRIRSVSIFQNLCCFHQPGFCFML